MSNLFKIELAALVLGVLGGAISLARSGGARGFKAWWNEEHWLFAQGGEAWRKSLAEPLAVGTLFCLYFAGVAVEAFCLLTGVSQELELWSAGRQALLVAFFAGKSLVATRYSGRQVTVLAAALGWFYLLNIITGYRPLAQVALLIVLLKDVDLKRPLRWVMGFVAGDVLVRAALVAMDLTGNLVQTDGGRVRMDLGQGSMNALGILVAQAAALWVLTRFEKLRWWDLAIALAAFIFIDKVPNSRGSMLLLAAIVLLLAAIKLFPRLFENRVVQLLCCSTAPAIAAAAWWFHYHYDKYSPWMVRLDKLLTGRLSLSFITQYQEVDHYRGIPLFGHAFVNDRFYRVDDSYIYYAYLCGPLMVVLLVAGFVFLTWKLFRSGRPELAVCVVVYSGYAAMERCLSTINFTLLFMPALLFGAGALCWQTQPRGERKPLLRRKS